MLNDVFSIERGLAAHGIDVVGRHADIKDMAKGRALRVRLADGGRVSSMEIIEQAGNGAVWTLRDGQHNGFPGLKTAAGLLSLDAGAREAHQRAWEAGTSPAARRDELLRLLATYPVDPGKASAWPGRQYRRRIGERLAVLRPLADDPLTAAVPAAFKRFLAGLDASPSFLEQLAVILRRHLRERGDEWLDTAREALIGPVMLAIDVDDTEFERDAGDLRQIGPVSLALGGDAGTPDTSSSMEVCALTGDRVKMHRGNYPEPNLPSQGQVKLLSRNFDVPSMTRYGTASDDALSISAELVARMAGALKTLTAPNLKNKVWRPIPGERLVSQGRKKVERWDLMIVSLPAAPHLPLAQDVAGGDADDDDRPSPQSAFAELTRRVVDQSRGLHRDADLTENITILVIRKVDKGNHKAIYHRNTTSTALGEAARRWQAATANTPDWLGFYVPVKGKSEAAFRSPPYVAPLSITPVSRALFGNGGRRRVDVIGVTAVDAFQLFLHEGDAVRRARDILRLLVHRHGTLLGGLAAARTKGMEHLREFDPKVDLRRAALRCVSWIGALLHHLDRSREVYMSDAGFRLGQLLAVADVVHVGYCMDVRDGGIPPSLLGNALLGMAAERPYCALALLLKRWRPYDAWAKNEPKVRAEAAKAEKYKAIALRRALSQARRVGPIAAALHDDLRRLDGKTDDAFQAELLLGYMAGLPKADKGEPGAADPDEPDQPMEGEHP